MNDTKAFDTADLRQFTGTEQWYRHAFVGSVLFTDGAKYVADSAGAYWLLDEIALAQRLEKVKGVEDFQVWKLSVKDSAATLTCEDGNKQVVFSKAITFTDFPGDGVTLWVCNNTILLPGEY